MNLSPGAYRLLSGVSKTLRRESWVDKKRHGKVMAEIEAWCAEYDIELAAHRLGNTLRFDQPLLARMDGVLSSLGQPRPGAELSQQTTAEQAKQGNTEAKSVRESPRAHRVLVSLPARPAPAWLSAEPREVLDLDWRHIELSAFDVLIQVENLDSFYCFAPASTYAFSTGGEAAAQFNNPLVVYRGDAHYGGGFARLADAWARRDAAHVYAGDFDAKGLGIALSSQATHVLLPPLAWLTQRATADHLPAEQMKYQPALRRHHTRLPGDHSFKDYLAIIVEQQRGLRQQWFHDEVVLVATGSEEKV